MLFHLYSESFGDSLSDLLSDSMLFLEKCLSYLPLLVKRFALYEIL